MDYLLQLSKNPTTRSVVKSLGLPLPMPPTLRRERAAWRERILSDATVIVGRVGAPQLLETLAQTLAASGASVSWAGDAAQAEVFRRASEAWAQPVVVEPAASATTSEASGEASAGASGGQVSAKPNATPSKVHALICDATGVQSPADLKGLYDFFSSRVRRLRPSGRVVVLSRPANEGEPEVRAARQALEGFTRSLAKELGRKGGTANLLWVEHGAEARMAGVLRFLLSAYSSFVTAQPLTISAVVDQPGPPVGAYRSLRSKVALVTGGSRGIGAETAQCLAREGARVIVLDRPGAETETSRLARKIDGSMLMLDVSADDASEQLSQFLKEQYGGVDIVVHNAGLTRDKTLGRMPEASWDSVMAVNLHAITRLTQGLLDAQLLRAGGRLVMLSSVGGIAGNVGQTNYAASKAALIGYVRGLAPVLAPRGVSVNAVAPGFIETQMTARMPVGIRQAARRLSALNQGGQPRDVAEVVTFMAMPWASGLTGNVLRVCGGALIGA